MSKEIRKFSIDGEIYTALEYGKFYLQKTHEESNEETVNPKVMTDKEIEEWATDFLEDRMLEDEDVFEVV